MREENKFVNLDNYQAEARDIECAPVDYQDARQALLWLCVSLLGECGELCEEIKRISRDDDSILTRQRKDRIRDEMGDVLWNLSRMASVINIKLSDVARANIDKMHRRHP